MDSNREHKVEIEEEFSFHRQKTSSTQNGEQINETESNGSSNGRRLGDFIPIYIPTIETGLMASSRRHSRFLDFLRARPTKDWYLKFGFNRRARRSADQANESSPSDPAPDHPGRQRRGFRVPFVRKINWSVIFKHFKKWLMSPANIAIFIWLILCAIGIVWVLLFMVGALDGVMPNKDQRDKWQEVINQMLNALFTMMCVYQHPIIFHHLVLVLRWRPDDQVAARSIYSKNGARRPHERAHIFFVVFLLHLTCAVQYVYCALFWGWSRKNRPDWPQYVCLGIGVAAPVYAAWYTYKGPLAKDIPAEARTDEESRAQSNGAIQVLEAEAAQHHWGVVVTSPEWIGGLFDCWDDMTGACLSLFCTFCVFGWNMERLGFGNMYVHTITFILLCISPFWIFYVSAINVDSDTIKLIVAVSGVVCCFFGLIYGGYWRTEMRKKFKLPGNPCCCGYPSMTDYVQWLFCWSCSLAQEVRTANFYDIEEDGFYRQLTDEEGRHVLVPLPREGNVIRKLEAHRSFSSPPKLEGVQPVSPSEMSGGWSPIELSAMGRASTYSRVYAMNPPLPPVMQTENE